MTKANEKFIEKAIVNQRKANKFIANLINSDEGTAFIYASNVKRRLCVPVNATIFNQLIKLSYKMGITNFSDSIALKMVNSRCPNKDIFKIINTSLAA